MKIRLTLYQRPFPAADKLTVNTNRSFTVVYYLGVDQYSRYRSNPEFWAKNLKIDKNTWSTFKPSLLTR